MPSKKKKMFHKQRNRDRQRKADFNDYNKLIENEFEVRALLGDESNWFSMTNFEQETIICKYSQDDYKEKKSKYGCLGCYPFETHLNLWNKMKIKCDVICDFLKSDAREYEAFYCDYCLNEMEYDLNWEIDDWHPNIHLIE
jgi:hypothetical protein